MNTGFQAVPAQSSLAVGTEAATMEGQHDLVALLDRIHRLSNLDHLAEVLVAEDLARFNIRATLVHMKIRPAPLSGAWLGTKPASVCVIPHPEDLIMIIVKNQEIDPLESPLDPDATQLQPPLSGTVDDNDDTDDEHWDENEPPDRALSTRTETQDEFRLDEPEEDAGADSAADDEDSVD